RIAASLEEDSPKRRSWARVYVTVTAVAVLAVGLNFGYMYLDGTSTIGAPEQFSHIAAAAHPSSPENELALLVGGVSDDMLPEDITAQVALIEAAIASNPDMYNAGEALCRIAGLEFHCLQRYGKAFSNYKQLHTEYPQLFDDCQECAARYNLLEEVRSEDYGPLYSLDLARNENSFTAFENIVADYPNTVLADAAVDEMRLLVQTARDDRGTNMADDLELVREQCSSPIAMAQVDLTLGHHYCNILNDRERAEACYKRVSAGGHISLAHQAHQALSEMD
ncbi:MAG: hypothetical protein KAH38_03035, partial [Candidatus Hydrogenedentes bacterium]|nr:hypothetical protein [Candidatus Hydrogenedentota bacterium]